MSAVHGAAVMIINNANNSSRCNCYSCDSTRKEINAQLEIRLQSQPNMLLIDSGQPFLWLTLITILFFAVLGIYATIRNSN